MQEKSKNDALDNALGFYYQCYVALEDCFNMKNNDELFVETDGDISIISLNGNSFQKEVKHHKNETNLNNKNIDFWKTLYNWLSNNIRYEKYDKLIFYTTADISNKSIFYDWNNANPSNRIQRLKLLEFNENDYNEKNKNFTYYYQQIFLKDNYDEGILYKIISKIEIECRNSKISMIKNDFYKYLSIVPDEHVEDIVLDLLGFLIGKIDSTNHKWSIKREEFTHIASKKALFYNPNPNEVPSDYLNIIIPIEEKNKLNDQKFVAKILEINLEKEVNGSIECYWKTQKTIIDFFNKDITHTNSLRTYRNTLEDNLNDNKKLFEVNDFGDEYNRLKSSRKFFYHMMTSPLKNIGSMTNHSFFQKGMMHIIADETDFKWKLGEEDEN